MCMVLRAAQQSVNFFETEDAREEPPVKVEVGKSIRCVANSDLRGKQHFQKDKSIMSGSRYAEAAFTVAFHENWQRSPILAALLHHMSHL